MKTIAWFLDGAAKRCAKSASYQWLASRCGRLSTFESLTVFSVLPAPRRAQ